MRLEDFAARSARERDEAQNEQLLEQAEELMAQSDALERQTDALQESRDFLETVLAHLADGVIISKEIVERHGGEIGVVCTPGEGATFWVQLPPDLSPEARRTA